MSALLSKLSMIMISCNCLPEFSTAPVLPFDGVTWVSFFSCTSPNQNQCERKQENEQHSPRNQNKEEEAFFSRLLTHNNVHCEYKRNWEEWNFIFTRSLSCKPKKFYKWLIFNYWIRTKSKQGKLRGVLVVVLETPCQCNRLEVIPNVPLVVICEDLPLECHRVGVISA